MPRVTVPKERRGGEEGGGGSTAMALGGLSDAALQPQLFSCERGRILRPPRWPPTTLWSSLWALCLA